MKKEHLLPFLVLRVLKLHLLIPFLFVACCSTQDSSHWEQAKAKKQTCVQLRSKPSCHLRHFFFVDKM